MEKITMTDSTIAFIGLGPIGDSTARAIRETWPDIRIMAHMRSRSRLEQTRQEGIVDVILDRTDESLCECDLTFLYIPVEYNAGYLFAIQPYLKQDALITGVGNTKCGIHEEIRRQGLEYCFMGGHPMAGSEKTGYENSTDHLLENAYYIVTPPEGENSFHPRILNPNAERIMAITRTIDVTPLVLDYREHDKVVVAIGHLPHLVASSLVNSIRDHDAVDGTMKQVATNNFKDITQIASSSPKMWEQIRVTNVEPISDILGAYIASLSKVLGEIREHKRQDIYRLFETSRDYRSSVTDRTRGSVEPSYEFTVDVSDEVGAVSTTSVILAAKGISVKNIGISSNREHGEGALKIAFYDEASMETTWQRLDKHKYEVFRM